MSDFQSRIALFFGKFILRELFFLYDIRYLLGVASSAKAVQNTRKNPTAQRNPRFVFAKSERATFFHAVRINRVFADFAHFFKTSGSIAKPYIEKTVRINA